MGRPSYGPHSPRRYPDKEAWKHAARSALDAPPPSLKARQQERVLIALELLGLVHRDIGETLFEPLSQAQDALSALGQALKNPDILL